MKIASFCCLNTPQSKIARYYTFVRKSALWQNMRGVCEQFLPVLKTAFLMSRRSNCAVFLS